MEVEDFISLKSGQIRLTTISDLSELKNLYSTREGEKYEEGVEA